MTRSARDVVAEAIKTIYVRLTVPADYVLRRCADRILSRLAEEGWVVVPREPSAEIVEAGREGGGASFTTVTSTWRAMLAAIDGKDGK